MWKIDIENIAGIKSGAAGLTPGVNAVQASNWQGKSSFIAALETAMGTATPLRDGADEGQVALTFESPEQEDVDLRLHRERGTITVDGEPYLTDEADRGAASLFAFFTENNDLREAVRAGTSLGTLPLRPLDAADLDAKIETLQQERQSVEAALADARDAEEQATELEAEISTLESELETLRAQRAERDTEASGDDTLRDELSSAEANLDDTKRTIRNLEREKEKLEDKLESKQEELESLKVPDEDTEAIEDRIESLNDELAELHQRHDIIEELWNANRRVLSEGAVDIVTNVERDIASDSVDCWICGNETTRESIEATVDSLQATKSDIEAERDEIRSERDDLQEQLDSIDQAREREQRLEQATSRLSNEIASTKRQLENARDKKAELEDRVRELSEQVSDAESDRAELHSEIEITERRLETKREQRENLQEEISRIDELENNIEQLTDEITSLRERKDRVKRETKEAFNEEMEAIVDRFNPSFEGAHLVINEDDEFTIVIARDGQQIGVDALSQGEVELVACIMMLAGYEALDVADRVPLILLDDVGGLAGENLRTLVEYLSERAEVVVTTAYPEQGELGGQELTPEQWDVVSDSEAAAG
jgi:DNA repair exonuclease SbcCD ATPase subunit